MRPQYSSNVRFKELKLGMNLIWISYVQMFVDTCSSSEIKSIHI